MDSVAAAFEAKRAASAISPVPDIMNFATSPDYLRRSLFPRQATALKLIFLGVGPRGENLFTDYDHEVIAEWINRWNETGTEGIQPDIYERMDTCYDEGRSWFREVIFPWGRRGSKNYIGAIAGAYILYRFIQLGDPHAVYGIDRDKRLAALVFAGKRDQAKAQQWRDLSLMIQGAPCFEKYVHRSQSEKLTLKAKYQSQTELDRAEMDLAAFEIVAKESTSLAGRGPASFMLFFDEFAQITPVEQADKLYDSSKPSLDQFHNEGFVFMPSSPWQKIGKFYERYDQAFEIDPDTGKAMYPELLVIQLPSWGPYKDWERTGDGGIPMLPQNPGHKDGELLPVQYFERKNAAVQDYDDQMRREEHANPETFRVERRAHFAAIIDAYLSEQRIKDIFEKGWPPGRPLVQQHHGVLPARDYYAHGDPSKSGANYGFAIAHLEPGELHMVTGETVQANFVIFDVLHAWIPGDFAYNDHEVDYLRIENDLKGYIDNFMPVSLTFDQWNSVHTIQDLRSYVSEREYPKRITIGERTANKALNWATYETFKAAVMMGLVRAPDHDLARLELTFLQDTGGKVEPPETGPVKTKDVADCMAIMTYSLIGEQMAMLMGEQFSNLEMHVSAPGGIDPFPESPMDPAQQLSQYTQTYGLGAGFGGPDPRGRRPVNPDGTFRRPPPRRRYGRA